MKTHKPTLTDDEVRQITARNHGLAASITTLRKMKLHNWKELKLDGMTVLADGTILRKASA